MDMPPIHIAIIDMYDGSPNIGMRCIHQTITKWGADIQREVITTVFDIRGACAIPSGHFDIYISTGGPGSPTDSITTDWDKLYTQWLEQMIAINAPVLLICHSFQIACRHFELGTITLRKSMQLGILPVHPLVEDVLFDNLQDPFFALESRLYQIIEPNDEKIKKLNARIIALEKIRPQVPLERAIMAIQFTDKMYGVQFHPEAEPEELELFFNEEPIKKLVIDSFGLEKWNQIMEHVNDKSTIAATYQHFIPNFLNKAILQ
jgi:GMP synthase-like glutamine amidotransferase